MADTAFDAITADRRHAKLIASQKEKWPVTQIAVADHLKRIGTEAPDYH
jgi:hypothetical protein